MKINDPNIHGASVGGANRADQVQGVEKGGRSHGAKGASGPSDQVQLSNLTSNLRALDSESPERAAYLERLAGEVASGRYDPDPVAVSRKIVSDAFRSEATPEKGD